MSRGKVPSIYHENCHRPGPRSNDYLPPPEARLFKSRSAPNSPFLERKPLIPRSPRLSRTSTQVVEKRLVEQTEKRSSKVIKVGRSSSFQIKETKSTLVARSRSFNTKGQAEQRNSLGKTWHPACLRCEECGKRLNPGQHSEHRGIPYCNIPCYSLLFGPGGYGRGGTESYQYLLEEKLTEAEQEAIRNEIIPKLKCYNMFYENRKALQLSSREVGGKLLLEGVLKVYWGLRKPVTLAGHRLGDWRKRSHKEHTAKNGKGTTESREKSSFRERTSSVEKIVARRRSFKSSSKSPVSIKEDVFLEIKSYQSKTTFIPPYGTSTNLRVTSRTRTQDVIKMLLSKFQIVDRPQKFYLYVVYDHGPVRKLVHNEFPLHCRLLLGPDEGLARIFVMEIDEGNTISAEVAQYIHFATPILEAFLQKFKEEEEKAVDRIKEKYAAYKSALQERLGNISTEV